MKKADIQSAVLTMKQLGQSNKAISRVLHIDVKTVRATVLAGQVRTSKHRKDKVEIDDALLEKLFCDCDGYLERMHEKLTEEHGLSIGYSTLTRLVRSKGLGSPSVKRSAHVPDVPGEEMQHDTSVYTLQIGGVKRKVICSGVYLRYSKMRYIRFYYRFNRFVMKCSIDEALRHWGYSARQCVIDNTNLAILYGSGSRAVMNPEMVAFANNYGFFWIAHEINHSDRKAGKERNFYTVETNFLPGRTFKSLEDMNEQARNWATVRYANRPQSCTKLIPAELFEHEKPFLVKLPDIICSPYFPLKRIVDVYGYVAIDANYYWVPQTIQDRTVTVLLYAEHICIMSGPTELVRYKMPPVGTRNEKFIPDGTIKQPRGVPNNRKLGCEQEENRLREMGSQVVCAYLDFLKSTQINYKAAFVRKLYTLYKQLGKELFIETVERVSMYQVTDFDIVQRTAQHLLKSAFSHVLPEIEHPSEYHMRQSYIDGKFTSENTAVYDLNE